MNGSPNRKMAWLPAVILAGILIAVLPTTAKEEALVGKVETTGASPTVDLAVKPDRSAPMREPGFVQATLAGQAERAASRKPCDPSISEKPNLSGKYNAVLITGVEDGGIPIQFQIAGDSFKMILSNANGDLGSTAGEGSITAVNTCSATSLAMKFHYLDSDLVGDIKAQGTSVSLTASQVGAPMLTRFRVSSFLTGAPVVLATARDTTGKLAGVDMAIVVCPEYPDCLKFPKCACPIPDK
jgi:hypothetical protein